MSHLAQPPRPSQDDTRTIDRVVTVVAFVGPLTSVPQIVEIWFVDKSAGGVSLITWLLFIVMAVIWLIYGVAHKQRPIVISNALWIVAQGLIVLGALRFDVDWL
jgi:MtN3 and saliva related transmembrane protein